MRKQNILKRNHGSYVKAERDIPTKVVHPFIAQLRYSFQTRSKLDFINGAHLFFQLNRQGTFNKDLARMHAAEIVLALAHLHKNGTMHRDLKPQNILLDADGHVVLTDFGLAKEVNEDSPGRKLVPGRRMLLQAQGQLEEVLASNSKGKYLRAEFGAQLRKKRRMRKSTNRETEEALPDDERDDEEDPQFILFTRLCEQFPEVASFIQEHPVYFVYLLSFSTDDTITRFFVFIHEFPTLADTVNWSPRLLLFLVHLRGSLGRTEFTALLIFFVALAIVLILFLFFGPRHFFHKFLILLLRFQRKRKP